MLLTGASCNRRLRRVIVLLPRAAQSQAMLGMEQAWRGGRLHATD